MVHVFLIPSSHKIKGMEKLLSKLNYKQQKRIAVVNATGEFLASLKKTFPELVVDSEIDQRYPYEFLLVFVRFVKQTEAIAPLALHNLVSDGVLWFAYPKKTSKKYSSDIDRDHGWEGLVNAGFYPVRQVAIDDDWSALRFRNARFIKSDLSRFNK